MLKLQAVGWSLAKSLLGLALTGTLPCIEGATVKHKHTSRLRPGHLELLQEEYARLMQLLEVLYLFWIDKGVLTIAGQRRDRSARSIDTWWFYSAIAAGPSYHVLMLTYTGTAHVSMQSSGNSLL